MKPSLSIIMPVYNNECYVQDTLESVLAQTYRDMEVLVIDDGSTDNSLVLCQKMASRDERVRVIPKENGGVSSARNRGLAEAQGRYIAFIDSDDCIDAKMYEVMIDVLEREKTDFVNCRVIKESAYKAIPYEAGTVEVSNLPLNYLSKKGCFIDSSWNKVYRRELIGDIRFNEKLAYSEDKLFVTEILLKARSIALVSNIFYHYIQHEDSLSRKDTKDVWIGNFKVHERIYRRLEEDGIIGAVLDSAFRGYVRSIIALLRYDIKYRCEEDYNRTLNEHREVLKRFLRDTPMPLGKKLEYLTYTTSYGLASLVHYYPKRRWR